jgi:hypothetical protein
LELDSIAPSETIKILNENSIKVTGIEQTLKVIANINNTTPSAIYELISAKIKNIPVQLVVKHLRA